MLRVIRDVVHDLRTSSPGRPRICPATQFLAAVCVALSTAQEEGNPNPPELGIWNKENLKLSTAVARESDRNSPVAIGKFAASLRSSKRLPWFGLICVYVAVSGGWNSSEHFPWLNFCGDKRTGRTIDSRAISARINY
jgi:hypothetical protein